MLVVGTGTGVGKTWVASGLIRVLRARGVAVAARKPAQSFDAADDPATRDAAVLGRASGEPPDTVCPPRRWYPVAMAPPMAAASLHVATFSIEDLLVELRWPDRHRAAPSGQSGDRHGRPGGPPGRSIGASGAITSVGVVELAGGVRSPQADDGDGIDLWRRLQPDVTLVVADAGLGTINAVRLTIDAMAADVTAATARQGGGPAGTAAGPPLFRTVVVLNRFEPASDLHRRNREWLSAYAAGVVADPVLTTPGDEERLADRVLAP